MFRILIADRQNDLLWALQRFLLADDRDVYVRTTNNGEQAIQLLKDEPFDLLITELKLKGSTDGFELLLVARELYPELRIILNSTLNEETTKRLGRRIGADVLLQKPFSLSNITEAVQYVRNQQTLWASKKIEKAGLADLVEMLCSKRRTSLIRLRNAGEHGLIAIDGGRLTHAEYGSFVGLDALNAMVSLDGGEIHLTTEVSVDELTITEHWDVALRKARKFREKKHRPVKQEVFQEPIGFTQINDSMVSTVVSRTQRIYRDFPTLRENADEFVRRCPAVLAYGLLRLNEVFSLSFQMSSGKRHFSDSQLIAYLDQIANVTRNISKLFGYEMVAQFSIEVEDTMVVMERIYQSKYAQVVVFKTGVIDLDFVNLLMTQMGANYSLALGGVER